MLFSCNCNPFLGNCIVAVHLFHLAATVEVSRFKLSNVVEICSIFMSANYFPMLITNKFWEFFKQLIHIIVIVD